MTRPDLLAGRPRSAPRLGEGELLAWSRDLAERERALADAEARFERRAERTVDVTATEIVRALETIRAWFPAGIVIAPTDDPRPRSSRLH